MRSLTELIHDLPPKLFDEIKELTFTTDGGETVNITSDYKPPVQLQINRGTRKAFAQSHYGTKTFLINDFGVIDRWLESLGKGTSNFPQTLQYHIDDPHGDLARMVNLWGGNGRMVGSGYAIHVRLYGMEFKGPVKIIAPPALSVKGASYVLGEVKNIGELLERERSLKKDCQKMKEVLENVKQRFP